MSKYVFKTYYQWTQLLSGSSFNISKIYSTLMNAKTSQACIYTFNNWLRICCIFSKQPEGGLGSIQREYFIIVFQIEFSDRH